MIDILCATIDETRRPGGLEHAPEHELHVSAAKGWANAANELLDGAAERGRDALFLDDDATLLPGAMSLLNAVYDLADVFGFTMLDGQSVVSAGLYARADGSLVPSSLASLFTPRYCAHVTTSAIYIKAGVLRAGVRFPVWPGAHHEDVAFTYACWLAGFRVMYVPGPIHHPLTNHGAGATKSSDPAFEDKRAVNARHLQAWIEETGVIPAIAEGRIPHVN